MFKVVVHKNVVKRLKNLKKAHLKKLAEVLETLKTNPVPWKEFDVRKIEGEENTYRIRIGDFRLVYFVDEKNKKIHAIKLERRGRVY